MQGNLIRSKLLAKGISLTNIATQLGVAVSSVSQVVHNKAISHRIRQAIADAIGVSVSELWPDAQRKDARSLDAKAPLDPDTSKDSRGRVFLSNESCLPRNTACATRE